MCCFSRLDRTAHDKAKKKKWKESKQPNTLSEKPVNNKELTK